MHYTIKQSASYYAQYTCDYSSFTLISLLMYRHILGYYMKDTQKNGDKECVPVQCIVLIDY